MVPQDDVVHRQLTVSQALGYAAELRLPPDTNKADRDRGRRPGTRRTRADQTRRDPRRPALRRAAQTRVGGARAAHRAVAADPRRADLGPGPGAGPAGHDDAATTGRRRPGGAGGHPLADLPRHVRPGAADGARRQDRVPGAAEQDRRRDGDHQLGPDLRARWAPTPRRPTAASWRRTSRRRPRSPRSTAKRAPRRTPVCSASSPRSPAARSGWSSRTARYFLFLAVLPFIMGGLSLTVPGNTGFGIAEPDQRDTRRGRPDSDAAVHRGGLHGHRADDPRPHRRTRRSSAASRRSACRPGPI